MSGSFEGICTDSADACNTDADCGAGSCYFPPGGCIEDLAVFCTPAECPDDPENPLCECAQGEYCTPTGPGVGTCFARLGECETEAQCQGLGGGGAFCQPEAALATQVDPFADYPNGVTMQFAAGVCVSTGVGPTPAGTEDTTCRTVADCATGYECQKRMVVAGSDDFDADGVPDTDDNCVAIPNEEQSDTDGDGRR